MSTILQKLTDEFADKEYREVYVEENLYSGIAYQLMLNRKARGLSQAQLAALVGTRQSVISRFEDPENASYSVALLLKIVNALDVSLSIELESFSDLVKKTQAWSSERAAVLGYEDEVKSLSQVSSPVFTVVTASNSDVIDTAYFAGSSLLFENKVYVNYD